MSHFPHDKIYTLNYELAFQLRQAGYPQSVQYGDAYRLPGIEELLSKSADEVSSTAVRIPTLEELIEACGVHFVHISPFVTAGKITGWDAAGGNGVFVHCEGNTPSEAVARLWLALNKKA
jgi:hypothetical protein